MAKRFVLPVFVVLLAVFLVGCVTRLADFTLISTKNIDLTRGASFHRAQSRVKGEDSASIIIIIPTGVPNMKTAIDKAIESVPGAIALLDGVLSMRSWYIPPLIGETAYIVEGTPLIDPAIVSPTSPISPTASLPSKYIVSKLDRKGNVAETKYVSKTEYDSLKKKLGI